MTVVAIGRVLEVHEGSSPLSLDERVTGCEQLEASLMEQLNRLTAREIKREQLTFLGRLRWIFTGRI